MFMPLNAAEILHALKVPHAKHLCTQEMNAENISAGQYLRLWPDMHGTDGFFAAVWQKTLALFRLLQIAQMKICR